MTENETGREECTSTASPTLTASISHNDARALTDNIRAALTDIWELVKRAYREKAWCVLGYDTWDCYCTAEFGSNRLRLPSEEREAVVLSLREAGLSIRDAASAIGCDKNTVLSDEKKHRASEFQTPVDLDALDGTECSKQPKPKPKRDCFYDELIQVQDHALKLEIICNRADFAAHRDYMARQHRDGLVWAQEIIARVLAELPTNQVNLFEQPELELPGLSWSTPPPEAPDG